MTPQEIVDVINNPKSSDEVFYTLEDYLDSDNFEEALTYLQETFRCDSFLANQVLDLYKTQIHDEIKKFENENSLTPQQIVHNQAIARESLNKPKCPICSSANLKKISTASKAVNTAMFGLLGTKRYKTFHCNNCGYEW